MEAPQRIILIAGPSAIGKSTLMARLRRGECPALCEALALHAPREWRYVNARNITGSGRDAGERCVVLHYDIIRLLMEREVKSFAEDPGLAYALGAADLRVCTMWGDGALLRERAATKRASRRRLDASALLSPVQWWTRQSRMRALQSWYEDDGFIEEQYRRWFAHLDALPGGPEHFVVEASQAEPIPMPYAQWSARRGAVMGRGSR